MSWPVCKAASGWRPPARAPHRQRHREETDLMVDVLREAGIRNALSAQVATVPEARALAANCYPIVLKPLRGAGILGVQVAHSDADVHACFAENVGSLDMWGNI